MDAYLELRCSIPAELEELLPGLFAGLHVLGMEIEPGESDRVGVTVYFRQDAHALRDEVHVLLEAIGGERLSQAIVEDEDWLAAFRESVQAFPVGARWWFDPHPDRPTAAPPGRCRIVMPPRTAFGSGTHESTRLILDALDETDVKGASLLDVGTGSGVLALAADALGARRVLAVDSDPLAIRTAVEICALQEWRPAVHFVIGSAGCAGDGFFDMVVCNMISAHSLPLLNHMVAALAPGGKLLLSGLLRGELPAVEPKLEEAGLTVLGVGRDGEWVSLAAGLGS
jgi:ribosomal protein L11 methyltransferase